MFNPVLSFWQKASLAAEDGMALDLSLDAGVSWITILQQTGLTTDWTRYEIDLSPYRRQTIWLRFRVDTASQLPEGVSSFGCWLDELSIYEVQPVLTPSLPPTTPTLSVLPTDSPTATATLFPAETATPLPSPTPTPVPTLEPAIEEPTLAPTHVIVTEDTITPESS